MTASRYKQLMAYAAQFPNQLEAKAEIFLKDLACQRILDWEEEHKKESEKK